MQNSRSNPKDQPNTYVMQSQQNDEDLKRLMLQARLFTASMGGPLAEQDDPSLFQRVLDVGCGAGSWVIEAAQTYPTMTLVGIDISQRMIQYARQQAEIQQVSERTEFKVMDALHLLEFPDQSFDFVYLRLGLSFMRTWDWPKMLSEILRVLRPEGILQITDTEVANISNSPALAQLTDMSLCAFFRAGHLFTQESTGLTAHLSRLLKMHGYQQIQSRAYALNYEPGTVERGLFVEDMKHIFHIVPPFLQKWGCYAEDYAVIYQQAIDEMNRADFHATWNMLSAWGKKSTPSFT